MRVISLRTLKEFWQEYTDAEEPLKTWHTEATTAAWKTPNDLKAQYAGASLITGKRWVFDIKGNDYRLVVDIEFRKQLIFIVWVGTHPQYDKIDVKTVKYERRE